MSSDSISVILERSLDLMHKDDTAESKAIAEPSAVSILLAERKRMKEQSSTQLEDFIPVNSSKDATKKPDYFLDQIAGSTTEAPTYWKGAGTQKPKSKQPSETIITNAKKALRLKGEEYEDKRLNKHASTASRKDRMHRLKNFY